MNIPGSPQFLSPMVKAVSILRETFFKSNVDNGHGIDHALKVLQNTDSALVFITLDKNNTLAVRLASLLHDADDHKFFPAGSNNAQTILEKVLPDSPKIRELVLKMIDMVSCSKNGIRRNKADPEWMLYPRWSDRLESLGRIGIMRAYQYTLHCGRPFETPRTAKTVSKIMLYTFVVTRGRFEKYLKDKKSESFIDHFYDKLLYIRKGFTSNNFFYKTEIKKRHRVIEQFILKYGICSDIDELIREYIG